MLLDFSEREGERGSSRLVVGAWGSYHGVSASAGRLRQLLNAIAAGCRLPLVFAFVVPVFGKEARQPFSPIPMRTLLAVKLSSSAHYQLHILL
jgi:hypothetical protein